MSSAKRSRISASLIFGNPVCLLAFGFGAGLSPKAPGTLGTLVAIPLYGWIAAQTSLTAYLGVTLALFLAGIWICSRCERIIGVEDHSGIVWDEIVGFFITMIAVPFSIKTVIAGFLLFRLFDIWKPWPIRLLDRRLHGGLGIMLDDVLAGFYAWGVMLGLVRSGAI